MSSDLVVEPTSQEDLGQVWKVCTEMAQNMAYPSFFCTGDWFAAVAEALSPRDELLVLQVRDEGGIRAVLPLVGFRNVLGGQDFRYLGSDFYPDPLGIVCAASDRSACIAAIKKYLLNRGDWDRLRLDWILEDELCSWQLDGTQVSVAPYRALQGDFSAVFAEFSKKKRYNLRAGVKRLLEAGAEFVTPGSSSEQIRFLDALFSLHRMRAAERRIQSSFSGPEVEKVHYHLAGNSDFVRFYGLQFEDKLIAVLYGYEFAGRFFYYQVAHNPGFSERGPGAVLLYYAIEDCCHKVISEFNFLQGDESYKGIWTKDSRILFRTVFRRWSWRSNALVGLDNCTKFFKKTYRWMRCVF